MSARLPDPALEVTQPEAPAPDLTDSVLWRAAKLRFPELKDLGNRERIDALTEHIVATAIAKGELEQLRLEAHVSQLNAKAKLARIPAAMGRRADEARRAMAPEIAIEIDRAQWMIDRCGEQINRLGGTDYDAASRAYTLLAGS